MAFNLDDFIEKAADAFDKSADDHRKKADQAEGLADLITDPQIRDLVDDLVLRGTLLVGTVGGKLKDIFAEDEKPAPEPEPEPAANSEEPEEDPFVKHLREVLERNLGAILSDEDQTKPRTFGDRFPF